MADGRQLPTRAGPNALVAPAGVVPYTQGGVSRPLPGDYARLADVVKIGFPVKDARTYVNRHLGNPVDLRLVQGKRGEAIGRIRKVEIQPCSGGDPISVESIRLLPDGSEASYFAPEDMVTVHAIVRMATDGTPPTLQPHDRIILHVPVRAYTRFLPGIYNRGSMVAQREREVGRGTAITSGWNERDQFGQIQSLETDPFERFLFIFQHLMTSVTDKIDGIPDLTDPGLAAPKFLPWISSWVNFELDESLPLHQQRELVRRSIRLHRTRGTKIGIEDMVKVLTSAPVTATERQLPRPAVLGRMTLAGGASVEDRYLRGEPPCHYLLKPTRQPLSFFVLVLEERSKFRQRFGERAPQVLRRIGQIVTQEKPAHVMFTIEFEQAAPE